jgi:hypothetical protein
MEEFGHRYKQKEDDPKRHKRRPCKSRRLE